MNWYKRAQFDGYKHKDLLNRKLKPITFNNQQALKPITFNNPQTPVARVARPQEQSLQPMPFRASRRTRQ